MRDESPQCTDRERNFAELNCTKKSAGPPTESDREGNGLLQQLHGSVSGIKLAHATPAKRRGKCMSRELVKTAISKNQEDGLLCVIGRTLRAKIGGYTFVNASAQSPAMVCCPRASANGKRGRLFKQAVRTPQSTSNRSYNRTTESLSASNQKSG
jgi:hypothetical protein